MGHLQHGWNPRSGWTLAGKELIRRGSIRYVWGTRQLQYAQEADIPVAAAVGAPWLYGPYLANRGNETANPKRSTTLLIPMHGTSEHPVQYSHAALADQVATEAGSALRVCLHINEARNDSLTKIYRERGYEVVTAGSPFSSDFLFRQASFISAANRVVTNRVSTALFYAASLRVPVSLVEQSATILGEGDQEPPELASLRRQILSMREDTDQLHELSMHELGFNHMKDPEELATALRLTGLVRAQYPYRLAISHVGRMARRLK